MIRDTSGQDVLIQAPIWHRRRRWLICGVVLIGLSTLAWPAYERWSASSASVALARLRTADVVKGSFERDASVQGKIVAANSPTLYSTSTGSVTLMVQAGDTVKKGTVLAEVDSPELKNELAREQAMLHSLESESGKAKIDVKQKAFEAHKQIDIAKIALTAAVREKKRADQPHLTFAYSAVEYEKISDEVDRAKVTYDNAVKQATLLDEALEFEVKTKAANEARQRIVVLNLQQRVDALQIRSPVDGMVGTLQVVNKTVVTPNMPIMMVVDLSAYTAELDVPESYADDLGIGMSTDIQINGQSYAGHISAISPEVKNNLVRCRVQWDAQVPPGLRQNQRLSARILFEKRDDVVMVARGPFFESSGGRFAYVIHDGVAIKRPIRTGASSVSSVEVLEGLQPGERIIVSATDDFHEAQQIMLTQ